MPNQRTTSITVCFEIINKLNLIEIPKNFLRKNNFFFYKIQNREKYLKFYVFNKEFQNTLIEFCRRYIRESCTKFELT